MVGTQAEDARSRDESARPSYGRRGRQELGGQASLQSARNPFEGLQNQEEKQAFEQVHNQEKEEERLDHGKVREKRTVH